MEAVRHRDTTVGELRRLSVTLPQAAQVLQVDVGQVRKAIDRHIVTATIVKHGKRPVRTLDGVDILCLRIGRVLKGSIRQELYVQLKHAPDREMLNAVVEASKDDEQRNPKQQLRGLISAAAAETVADIKSLADVSRYVDNCGLIRGADVEAHRIAALVVGGMSADEVIDDYPNLDAAQIGAALKYAEANPKQGRPYPTRTAKSVLRKGGGGGLAAAFAAAAGDEPDG